MYLFQKTKFVLNIVIFASRVLFSVSWRRLILSFLIVRSHSLTRQPAIPTSD